MSVAIQVGRAGTHSDDPGWAVVRVRRGADPPRAIAAEVADPVIPRDDVGTGIAVDVSQGYSVHPHLWEQVLLPEHPVGTDERHARRGNRGRVAESGNHDVVHAVAIEVSNKRLLGVRQHVPSEQTSRRVLEPPVRSLHEDLDGHRRIPLTAAPVRRIILPCGYDNVRQPVAVKVRNCPVEFLVPTRGRCGIQAHVGDGGTRAPIRLSRCRVGGPSTGGKGPYGEDWRCEARHDTDPAGISLTSMCCLNHHS